MNDIPVASIICLTYNHKDYIGQCLDGILSQETDYQYEIIVFDDASTDGTSDIIRDYCSRYNNIVPLIQTENQYSKGLGFVGMEIGLAQSRGRYVAICDGDDFWVDSNKLQVEIDFLEGNPQYGFVFTDFSIVDNKNELKESDVFKNNPGYLEYSFVQQLKSPGYYAPMTWCFRKECIEGLFVPIGSCDFSYAVWLHYLSLGNVGYIDQNTARYRFMGGTTSHPSSKQQMYSRQAQLFKEQLMYADHYKVDDEVRNWICSKRYLELLPKAIEYHDDAFCREAKSYFEARGIVYDAIVSSMDELYYKQNRELKSIKASKAYRLGKKIAGFYNFTKQIFKR